MARIDPIMLAMIERNDRERRLIRWADEQLAYLRDTGQYRLIQESDPYHVSRGITGVPSNANRVVRAHDTSQDMRLTDGEAHPLKVTGAPEPNEAPAPIIRAADLGGSQADVD